EAEGRAVVADVVPVEELLVVVEDPAGPPGPEVRGVVGDGVPPGLAERVAEGEPIAGDELVVALVAIDPQPRLQGGVGEPADPAEGRGGQPGALGGPAGPGQRGGVPAQDGVDSRREAPTPDGDLPVAFDDGDDDVLAAQSGQQIRGGDGGLGVAAVDGPPENTRVVDRCPGGAHLRVG